MVVEIHAACPARVMCIYIRYDSCLILDYKLYKEYSYTRGH